MFIIQEKHVHPTHMTEIATRQEKYQLLDRQHGAEKEVKRKEKSQDSNEFHLVLSRVLSTS